MEDNLCSVKSRRNLMVYFGRERYDLESARGTCCQKGTKSCAFSDNFDQNILSQEMDISVGTLLSLIQDLHSTRALKDCFQELPTPGIGSRV